MKTQPIGTSSLLSTRLAYGCMRVSIQKDPSLVTAEHKAQGKRAIMAAYEAGYRLFDHADIYGRGMCETIFGEFLKEHPCLRDDMLIATKCGIRFPGDPAPDSPHRYDFSAEHIRRSCENSLRRLSVETIDLYQLHRPDFLMDGDEVAGAFDQLRRQGKVREFGVSNFAPSQVAVLQSRLARPLVVNQVEIHLGRLACLVDGTLDQCVAERMTPLSWSPVGKGLFATGGIIPADHPHRERLLSVQAILDELAAKHNVTRTAIALAWLLKHPSGIIPIVGSVNPEHIRQAALADSVELTREDWYRLLVAARGEKLP